MDLINKKTLFTVLIVGLNTAATVHGDYSYSDTTYRNEQRTGTPEFVSDQDIHKAIHNQLKPGWFSSGNEQVSAQVYNGNVTLQGYVKTVSDKEKIEREVRDIKGVKNLNSQIIVQEQNSRNAYPSNSNQPGYNNQSGYYNSDSSRNGHPSNSNQPGYNNQSGYYNPRNVHPGNSNHPGYNNQPGYYNPESHNPHQTDTNQDFPQDRAASPADDQLNKKIRDNVSRGWLWNSYKEVKLNTNNGNVSLEGNVESRSDQQKLIDEVQKVQGVRSVRSNLNIRS